MTTHQRPALSLAERIDQHTTSSGAAIMPPRIARWLEHTCKLTDDRRIRLRDTDPEAYVALTALHLAALRSETGTNAAAPQVINAQSTVWMSTSEAAKAIGVTDRCIRKWCANGRLHATLAGGRWLINRNSIADIA